MKGPLNRGGGGGGGVPILNGMARTLQLSLVLKLVQMRVDTRIFAMQ
jgi:hypothetical protein